MDTSPSDLITRCSALGVAQGGLVSGPTLGPGLAVLPLFGWDPAPPRFRPKARSPAPQPGHVDHPTHPIRRLKTLHGRPAVTALAWTLTAAMPPNKHAAMASPQNRFPRRPRVSRVDVSDWNAQWCTSPRLRSWRHWPRKQVLVRHRSLAAQPRRVDHARCIKSARSP
jgi:hypothetical protein